jgi:predicted transcriptional regulator of viral defense system
VPDKKARYALQFRRNKHEVESYFDRSRTKVFGLRALQDAIRDARESWRLLSVPISVIVELLVAESRLTRIELSSDIYGTELRYAWGTPSAFELAQSLRQGAYLSHGTAVYLHGLTQDIPQTFYVNKEQSPKKNSGTLTQESLDRAFASNARQSNLVLSDSDGRRFVLLAGKFTGRLEVSEVEAPGGELVSATKLERTLIDITVRPLYTGGIAKVMEAWATARDRASVNVVMATLAKLEYMYPYHQAIGFYLERAGYDARALELTRRPGLNFDFYLSHGIKDKAYSREWRLYYPKGL